MAVNKYVVTCGRCQRTAKPGTAYIQKDGSRWNAEHIERCEYQPRLIALGHPTYGNGIDVMWDDISAAEWHDYVGVDGGTHR